MLGFAHEIGEVIPGGQRQELHFGVTDSEGCLGGMLDGALADIWYHGFVAREWRRAGGCWAGEVKVC